MSFNNGNERRKLNAKWEQLRVQYREAGMSEEAIQAMYEFDLGVLNSERAYDANTVAVCDGEDDVDARKAADLKQYDQLGEEIYCEALRHIVEAWEGRPDSFRAAVLRGVMYFVQLYRGQYSEERLVRALSGVHPMELYRISRDNPAKLPGWRRYVYPIYTTYNGKCRKDALPMKF